jgi:hypothetical protein
MPKLVHRAPKLSRHASGQAKVRYRGQGYCSDLRLQAVDGVVTGDRAGDGTCRVLGSR